MSSQYTQGMPDSAISLHLRTYDDEVKQHTHSHHQIVLPLAGALALSVDAQEGEVAHRNAAIIPAGRGHGFLANTENRFLVADVPEGLAPALERLPCFVELDQGMLHYVQFLYHQMIKGSGTAYTQQQMLLLLIQLLQERHGDALALDRRVSAAKQLIDERFRHPIMGEALCRVANLSARQLNDLFRTQVGMTPHQYLTELRMKEAWRLLEHSDMSVQRVADAVGYQTLSSFSDRFRQHFGKAPSHFRRKSK